MRKVWSVVAWGLAALALLWSVPALASQFDDVPQDHWAYDALDYLQEAGLVEGYPDGTFKGNRPFTRYEMAMVVARVFTKIQDFQASLQSGTSPNGEPVDLKEVYARMDKLSDEFRDELKDLGARVTALEDEQTRQRGDIDDLKALVKDSGLTGEMRVQGGEFFAGGSHNVPTDIGWASEFKLNYMFHPDRDLDVNLKLKANESDGFIGTFQTPGMNNEQGGQIATPPLGTRTSGSSFLIDEMNARYHWHGAPNSLGESPTVTLGRQYFSQGEFGLAGDNGFRSNFGLRFDTTFGANFDGYLGYYRMNSTNSLAPWANVNPNANQSSAASADGDDYLLAGLEYHAGETEIPGHDYSLVARADYAPNGFGQEQYIDFSGNATIPWFNDTFLNGVRGEWLYVMRDAAGHNPNNDLGLTPYSWILELDVFNDGRSRVSLAGAQIAQVEGLPVLANVDNDPFSEYDFTVNELGDGYNFSHQGRNYFPSDFNGFGIQAEHSFNNKLHSTLTWYTGKRIDATANSRPGMLRLNLKYPVTDNSQLGLDFIAAGERNGLSDNVGLVRGEYKITF
jgi:hypothetical protein